MDYIQRAQEIINLEIQGLSRLKDELGEAFEALVRRANKVLDAGGKLVVCGVGKSGHIGHKLAATLASTGSPAVFMHPVEAMHGDLGMLGDQDLLLALSYSGETEELLAVIPAVKRFGIPVVGICGDPESRLAKWSDLIVPLPQLEALDLGLPPPRLLGGLVHLL